MLILRLHYFAIVFFFLCSSGFAEERQASSLAEAFELGTASLGLRYRYEHVDQENFTKDANASTLQSRLSFNTAKFSGFNAFIEGLNVQGIGGEAYNDTINGKDRYPTIADPSLTELKQAYLAYVTADSDLTLRGGRRILNIDDSRFIGDVGWRQNPQSFDGVDFEYSIAEETDFNYYWIYQVNRVFGSESEQGKFNTQNHLFTLNNKLSEEINLSFYSYLLDIDERADLSSATMGSKLSGKEAVSELLNFLYEGSYARQIDYGDNPVDYGADYYRIVSGLNYEFITLQLGYEVLSSDSGKQSFQTPLATLHKFNGWADQFLTTPDTGLRDHFVQLDFNSDQILYEIGVTTLSIRYHDFRAEDGGDRYGQELDLSLIQKIYAEYYSELKFSTYHSHDYSQDTEKIWLTFGAKFSTTS